MTHPLMHEIARHGNKAVVIPVSRLSQVRKDILEWLQEADLTESVKQEIWENYNFQLPALEFEVKSIVLVACPFPAYAEVEFGWQGKQIPLQSIVAADLRGADSYVRKFARIHGFQLETATGLPVKRLVVCSGLAEYGRNNITYVEGMGSFLYYLIYFSDLDPIDSGWRPVRHAEICSNCQICFRACETGAILKDRFLLDTPRCLCYLNESPDPFPGWLPLSVHHVIYDCLKCQLSCPMNRDFKDNVAGPVKFTEEETSLILKGSPLSELPEVLYEKVCYLGFDVWWEAIPRNLKLMLELSERRDD